ncbi:MAG: extradiol dioxygenase, partial [Chthonomonadales bacterium]
DRLHEMLNWHQSWIDGALTDAYWQTLVLHGISEVVRLKPSVKSYEAPTYFGMLTAEFTRE